MAELDAYVRAMVEERRSRPADDLLTDLIAAEEAGRPPRPPTSW